MSASYTTISIRFGSGSGKSTGTIGPDLVACLLPCAIPTTYKLHLIVTFLYISSGMILEASGKIGKRRGKRLLLKVVVVVESRMNGKDGNRDGDTI